MKSLGGMHFLFGIFLIAIVLPLSWNYFETAWANKTQTHAALVEDIVERKLEMYKLANGQYPDSINALAFTNSTLEIQMLPDIQKIKYYRTQSGYELKYGIFGLRSSVVHNGN
jgi:hypothetical protein